MIPKDTIAQIFETARVEEVVGDFVHLKKKGTNLWGCCPFHNEKTPSFSVSPAKGIYKCFGCGAGGNAVNFVMEHEQMTYPEALRYLAKKYSIEIQEQEQTPEQQAEDNHRESLLHVLAFAQRNFSANLHATDEGRAIGLAYLRERGFSDETIAKFQLGWCMDSHDTFARAAKEQQYAAKYLEASGLCMDRDGKLRDRFYARVMFPIHSLTGSVIAFGGRTLRTDKKVAKYINSPETDVYHKSKVLYGIFQAKKDIIRLDECYLVEGYTDVISLHQAGVCNVVASSGTSLTVEQIRLVKRYTPNLTVMYDGDAAGIKASFRGIDLILEEGMNVRTVLFPDGDDPDSFARKHGGDELRDYVKANATDFIEFKTRLLAEDAQGDPIRTAALIKDIIGSIALVPDPITRTLYVRKCSTIMQMDEETLMLELNRQRRRTADDKARRDSTTPPFEAGGDTHTVLAEQHPVPQPILQQRDAEAQERDIIRILLQHGSKEFDEEVWDEEAGKVTGYEKCNVADFIHQEVTADGLTFSNPVYQRVFDEFSAALAEGGVPAEHHFTHHPEHDIAQLAASILASPYVLSENWKTHRINVVTEEDVLRRSVLSAVHSFKLRKLERIMADITEELKAAPAEDTDILLDRLIKYQKVRRQLADEIGAIVLK